MSIKNIPPQNIERTDLLEVTVVVCTYNRKKLLEMCLESLIGQVNRCAPRVEVVVVDNNCTDGTEDLLRQITHEQPFFRWVREEKQGLSHARNRGAAIGQGRYLAYLDDDAKASSHYIDQLLRVIDEHRPDIFGGPIYPFYTSPKPSWFDDSSEIRKHAEMSGFCHCPISGGNYVIRKDLLRALGGFDPSLGMQGHKIRLGEERALLEKYRRERPIDQQRTYYSLECFVYHHVPEYKMRWSYLFRRGYASGRSAARIKGVSFSATKKALKTFCRTIFQDLPSSIIWPETKGVKSSTFAIRQGGIALGKIHQHASDCLLSAKKRFLQRLIIQRKK